MHMRKILSAVVPLAALLAGSCSQIAEEDRLIYVEPQAVQRNVLIEDFTGQRCTNCPKATEAIEELQGVYGEHVIAVAIHSGPFGFAGNAKNIGLKNELGQTYWDSWFDSTQGQPVAKINRGAKSESTAEWSGLVREELAKTSKVSLQLTVDHREETEYSLALTMVAPATYKGKLQCWLVEDSIVAMQMQPDGSTDKEYVHNHVLREALNGTWGEEVSFDESTAQVLKEITFTLDDRYVAEHCSVVAFVYDEDGVQQVVKEKMK